MRNENITVWADDLATTTEQQCTGHLAMVDSDGHKAYCCLGFGSMKVPGLQIKFPEPADFAYAEQERAGRFGVMELEGLAPVEFMTWLGYTVTSQSQRQFEVYFDIPPNWRIRSYEDVSTQSAGGNRDFDHTADLMMVEASAAVMNDDGHTFRQIADMIRYFGLSDDIVPNWELVTK